MRAAREFPADRVTWLPSGNSRQDPELPENIGQRCTPRRKVSRDTKRVLLPAIPETTEEIVEGIGRGQAKEKENSPDLS